MVDFSQPVSLEHLLTEVNNPREYTKFRAKK